MNHVPDYIREAHEGSAWGEHFPMIVLGRRQRKAALIVAVIVFAMAFSSGCGPISIGPVKPPAPIVATVEQAASASLRAYHTALSAAFETLASEIEQGGIEDDEDLASRMEELTKTARLGSFEAFRQSWAKAAGAESPWDDKQRAAICRETARGFAR